MLRRIVLLLVLAAVVVLVFVLRRGGNRNGQPAVESIPMASPAQGPDLALPALSPSGTPTVREESRPSKPRAKRSHGKSAALSAAAPVHVSGWVVDDVGAPITEFAIEARCDSIGKRSQRVERSFESSAGRFALPLVPGEWELSAHNGNERRSTGVVLSVTDGTDGIELVIPRSGAISGIVVGGGGVPVADAEVHLHYPGEDEIDFAFGQAPVPRARTDGPGSFHIQDVLPESVEIMARHPEYADGEWTRVPVPPGTLVERVEIELTPGGRIEGHADPSLGDVAERVIGLFSFRGGMGWRDTRTDSAGRFVIEHVMPQDYVIELYPAGYSEPRQHQLVQNEPGIRKNISVMESQTTRVVFGEPRRRIAIHGVVQDDGAPVSNLFITPRPEDNEDHGGRARTGPDGRFELTVNGAGDYRFSVWKGKDHQVTFRQDVPDQSDLDVVFELPNGAVSGRVTNSDGRPLWRVQVTLVRSGCTGDALHGDCYRSTLSRTGGSFRFQLLAPGSYTLRAPDGAQPDATVQHLPHGRVVMPDIVVDESEVAGIELRCPVEGRISGTVVDADGDPVVNALVGALDGRGFPLAGDGWDTRTDATGHFEIGNVGPGTHSVRARSGEKEARSPPFEVEAGKAASVRVEIR